MALKLYPEENIQSIASAIRAKNGLSTSYTVSQMASAISDIPSGMDENTFYKFLFNSTTYTTTVYKFSSNTPSIGQYAFAGRSVRLSLNLPSLTQINGSAFLGFRGSLSIYAPNCRSIADYAFYDASITTSLEFSSTSITVGPYAFGASSSAHASIYGTKSVSLPHIVSIPMGCFENTALENLYAPEVTTVGSEAFSCCGYGAGSWGLSSVSFPVLTEVKSNAFHYCWRLSNFYAPNLTTIGNSAFYYCRNLSSIALSKVTTIGYEAFYNCALTGELNLPVCTSIYSNAFWLGNYSITKVKAPVLTYIGSRAFAGCSGIQEIDLSTISIISAEECFSGCSSLSIINMPMLTTLSSGGGLFKNCIGLTSVELPSLSIISNTTIFSGCTNITTLKFPNLVKIQQGSFGSSLNSLSDLSLPKVQFIQPTLYGAAFANGLSSLKVLSLPELLSTMYSMFSSSAANNPPLVQFYAPKLSTYPIGISYLSNTLANVTLTGLISASQSGFKNLSLVSEFNLPMLSSTYTYLFQSCKNLETVRMPNASYSNLAYAFSSCPSLKTVLFGNHSSRNITGIPNSCFNSCYNLLSLYLLGSTVVPLANYMAFASTPISNYTTSTGGVHGSIYVPASLYNTYKASTNWVWYSNRFASLTDAEIEALLNS